MNIRFVALSHAAVAAWLAVAFTVAGTEPGLAHKAITSKYTYNEDMFPLFREHCGRCHVDGGVAPMSLLTHDDAAPWAESLRLELLSEDPPNVWHKFTLTAREFDTILVWANGGTPRGKVENAPPPSTVSTEWPAGAPDLEVKMAAPFTLAADANEAPHAVTLAVAGAAGKTLRALDLKPGTPSIVRSATLWLHAPGAAAREIGRWLPGQTAAVAMATPVAVPAGASIEAKILYMRTWKYEGQALSDSSTLGLYFK